MTDSILSLCARAQGYFVQYQLIQERAAHFPDWENLPAAAEHHGLGPLAYEHLTACGVPLPKAIRRALQGLALRHRQAAAIRTRVLAEILTAFRTEGIDLLLLKGAALAYLVYPRPGLRPMRDLDGLVREGDALRAQGALRRLGFGVSSSPVPPGHQHLPAMNRETDGLQVSVEIHTRLFPDDRRVRWNRLDDFFATAMRFEVAGVTGHTLSREDMLWHVYRHAFGMPLSYEPLRLIWVADLVSLVELWLDELDWDLLERRYARAVNALPALHVLTPWSERAAERLELDPRVIPGGSDQALARWPGLSFDVQRRKGRWRALRQVFFPPQWWLRVRYGVRGPVLWVRWVRHPAHVVGEVLGYAVGRSREWLRAQLEMQHTALL